VPWDIRVGVISPEKQQVAWDVRVQVTEPENQAVNDIKFVLEYTIS
jgi:hypothetical protein